MRIAVAFAAGGLFGLGLVISGMTDTTRVQGWLDVFGAWDPTLAFVLGGAILPMLVAWRIVAARADKGSVLGTPFPVAAPPVLDRQLIVGSALFGLGWGLAGLCPGPAMASLSYGRGGGVMFFGAMVVGMIGVRRFRLTAASA